MPPTRASPRVTATISAALSPPEPKHLAPRPSPAPTAATGLFQFQFAPLDRCGDDTSKTRVSLRSTAPALLLQSPVQRAGRAIGFADAERHAAARNCRRERSLLMLTFYIRRGASAWRRVRQRRRRPHRRPVRPCRATRRVTDVRRTWVALRRVWPHARHGAPFCISTGLVNVRLAARL